MKQGTWTALMRDGEILLAMKKRGFGVGKWNGAGGKVTDGETVEAAAIREFQEEIGVMIAPEDLDACGLIHFRSTHNPGLNWDVQEFEHFVRLKYFY